MRRSDRPSGRSEFVEADAAKRSRDRRHCALRSLTVETEVVGGIPSLAGHARQSRATPNAAVCKIPHQPVGVKDGVREPARRPAIADHLDAQATCLIRDEVAHRLTRRLHNNEVDLVLFCMARRHILQHRNAASYGRHCCEGSKRDVPRAESTVEMGRALYRNVCANGGGGCCQRDPATALSQGVGRTYRWPETGAIVNHQASPLPQVVTLRSTSQGRSTGTVASGKFGIGGIAPVATMTRSASRSSNPTAV